MEVNFSNTGGSTPAPTLEQPANQPQNSTAVATTGPTDVAPGGLLLGDKLPTFKDIILPRLNIVQSVGTLKDSFPFGSLVFDQKVILFTPPDIDKQTGNIRRAGTPPAVITVLGFRPTRYAEKVAGGGRGMIVDTEDAVRQNGGTLDYNEWNLKKAAGMKRFEPLAEALVAIERPAALADDDTIFVWPVGTEGNLKKYALAIWGLKGTSYTAAAKRVFFNHRAMGCLRTGYPTWSYAVSTRVETRESNSYSVPVCLPYQKSSPEFLAFVQTVLAQ